MRITKQIGLIVLALSLSCTAFGQLFQGPLGKANKQYDLRAFNLAIQSYKEALERRPNEVEALAKLADCYRHLNQMEEAAKYYARAIAQQRRLEPAFRLQYGHVLKAMGQYDAARREYLEYAKSSPVEGNHYAQSCNFAINQQNVPSKYTVTGEFINSSASDFGPALFGNSQVVFSSARMDIQRTSTNWTGGANNQLFVANIGRNGFLESPYFLKSDAKNVFNEGPVSYSRDGRWVAYTKNNFADGTRHIASSGMDLSIFIAEISSSGDWINPVPFPYNGNDFSVGFPSFSPDGNALYFASNRLDGFGGYDIYVSYRVGEGNNWGAPQNLGPVVNSPGNEVTPFNDGEMLYFSSDWHEGLGGYDIFRAEQANGRWVRIFHMGNGINSPRDDYGFIFENVRNVGYLVSNRVGGRGSEDIYRASQSADNVTIRVKDAATGAALPNAVIDFSACREGAFTVDAQGVYTFQAVRGLQCNLLIRRDGYLSRGLQLSMSELQQNREFEILLPRIGEEYLGRIVSYTTRLPLDEATVTATNQTTSNVMTMRTDLNGDYMLALSPNTTYIVRYSRPGYRDINRTVRVGSSFDRDALGVISMIPTDAVVTDVPLSDIGVKSGAPTTVAEGFAVQLAAMSRPNLEGFAGLNNIGNIYYRQDGSIYRIRMGTYRTREEAERVLGLVKNQGYREAFIVQEQGGQMGGPTTDLTPKTPSPTTPPPTAATGRYKIQLAAYRDARNFDAAKLEGLGRIEDVKRSNFTVKYLAAYATVEEARQVLRSARAAGFKDAFIVEDVNGTLRKVN